MNIIYDEDRRENEEEGKINKAFMLILSAVVTTFNPYHGVLYYKNLKIVIEVPRRLNTIVEVEER